MRPLLSWHALALAAGVLWWAAPARADQPSSRPASAPASQPASAPASQPASAPASQPSAPASQPASAPALRPEAAPLVVTPAPRPPAPAGQLEGEQVVEGEDVVVTATRSRRRNLEVAEKVSVIGGEMIAERVQQNMVNLMRWEAGVRVDNGPAPYQENVSIRGLGGERVQLAMDGRRWATSAGVHGGLFNVDMTDIKRVEVLHGAASALYGSRAIAGVVNIIPLDPADRLGPKERIGASIRLGFTSLNTGFKELGRVYGAHLGRKLQWQLSVSRTDAGRLYAKEPGWLKEYPKTGKSVWSEPRERCVSAGHDATSVASRTVLLAGPHRIDLNGGYYRLNPVLNDGEEGLETPSPIKIFERDVTRKEIDNYRAGLTYKYRPGGAPNRTLVALELASYLSGGTTDDIHDDDFLRSGQPNFYSIQSSSRYSTLVLGLEPRATLKLSGGRFANEITVGVLGELERATHEKDATETTYASHDDRTVVDQTSTTEAMFPNVAFWSVAAYVQDEITLFDKLLIVPGLRYDHFFFVPDKDTPGFDKKSFDDPLDAKSAGALSPKLTVTYRALPNWSVSAIAARGFRMTGPETRYYNFYHVGAGGFWVQGDPSLDPESSWNFELGTKVRVWRAWISASAFLVETDDFVPDVPMEGYEKEITDQSGNVIETYFIRPFKNIGHQRLVGGELELEIRRLFKHLDIKLNLTAMTGRAFAVPIIDELTGKKVGEEDQDSPVVPLFGTLSLIWRMQHGRLGWHAGADLRVQTKQLGTVFDYETNYDVLPPPGFAVLGLNGGLSWSRRYRLNAGIHNLLNTPHIEPQNRLLRPSAGLTAFVSLSADL